MKLRFSLPFILLLLALPYLAGQSADPPKKAVVTGKVLNAVTGEPVKKAHVALSKAGEADEDAAPSFVSITDADGHFSFDAVDPGSYRLAVQRSGFARTQYGATAADGAGTILGLVSEQKLEITIKMVPLSVIAGRVLDADGDAVPDTTVSAIRSFFANGKREIERIGRTRSNDLGEYRLYDLPPGRYYIAASIPSFTPAGAQTTDEDSGLIYYQDATDLGNATPLELAAGNTLANIDMMATKARRVTISGTVLNPPAGGSVRVSLVPRDSTLPLKFIRQDAEYHDENGKFEIHGVAPGTYVLAANALNGNRRFSTRQQLAVTGSGVPDIALSLSPGVDLYGHVRMEGQSALDLAHISITLQSRDEGGTDSSPVTRDGAFAIANVVPNTYVLSVNGLPRNCYVKSVSVGQQEFPPTEVDLTRGPSDALSIVVSAAAGQLSGVVVNDKQQPASGALVVLVPAQRQRGDLYKTTATNSSGGFSLEGIAPGDYKLFAWQGVDTGAYQDPDFLKRFEDQGEAVSLSENGSRSVQLKIIPQETSN